MIIVTHIYLCEICGKIISETNEGDRYGDDLIDYPKGWIEVWKDDNHNVGYCPECAEKHKDKYYLGKNSFYCYK